MLLHTWINRYRRLGYSFFNTGTSEKKCLTKWTTYQTRKPTDQELVVWSKLPTQNWGIVCGEISDLIVFDVDTKNGADPSPFQNRGLFEVRTPSGGYHFYCKYDPLLKSTKHKRDKTGGILHAVDVQSNGSLVFAPPSKFPNGEYTIVNDVPVTKIPDDLLAMVVDALEPEKDSQEYTPYQPTKSPEMGRPGDIFNALATWDDVLIPAGWKRVGGGKTTQYWRRPGKEDGISASTNWNGYGLFFAFTTSVGNIEPLKGYTKFHLLAVLKYDGDFKRAAKELVMENYRLAHKLI